MDASAQENLAAAEKARIDLDYETAKSLFETVLGADDQLPEALHGLGYVQMMGFGEFDEGIALMEQAASLAPANQKILLDLAKSYAMLAEDDKAKSCFEKVVAIDPTSKQGAEAQNQLQYY